MRRVSLLLALLVASAAHAGLPDVALKYSIDARLVPATRDLRGTVRLTWINPTGTTLTAVPVHLYLNGFASEGATWIREADEFREAKRLVDRGKDPWGWTRPVRVTQQAGGAAHDAAWRYVRPDDGNTFDRSLAEVTLPVPVEPGGTLALEIAFEARMPMPLARTGCTDDFCLLGQWFPKLGVIEPAGVRHAAAPRVAARQFHGVTEFYADFADFDVRLTAPAGWLVGGTGREVEPAAPVDGGVRHHFAQRAVHDVAFVAGSRLVEQVHRTDPHDGGPAVDVHYIVPKGTEHQVPRWRRAAEGTLAYYGTHVGAYPYETLTVVQVPPLALAARGMEYPTFVTGLVGDRVNDHAPARDTLWTENTIVHEIGHQWFYGLIANDEQREGYLDEGFNTYWEYAAMDAIYGAKQSMGTLFGHALRMPDATRLGLGSRRLTEPLGRTPTAFYADDTWSLQIYIRTGFTLLTAEGLFGKPVLERVFKRYFERYAFRHPDLDDFLDVVRESAGDDCAAFLREAFREPHVPDFVVEDASSTRWEAPRGFASEDPKAKPVTRDDRKERAETLADPAFLERDGRVLVEITDPGFVTAAAIRPGAIERRFVAPQKGEPTKDWKRDGLQETVVRVTGPGWQHLPCEVVFRFEDGAVVRDTWDGRATWRRYRFVRPARLRSVQLDPDDRIALDPRPQNNGYTLEPDRALASDWGAWIGAVGAWLASGVGQWL